ncbi:MAG: hypothetical protein GWP35_07915 [Proteobacteria bacterium]|nr:hypothetical protein [Pseudomonadota bacterium]
MKNQFSKRAAIILLILLISLVALMWLLVNRYSAGLCVELAAAIEEVVPESKAQIESASFEFISLDSFKSGVVLKGFEFSPLSLAEGEQGLLSVDQFSIRGHVGDWLSPQKERAVMVPQLNINFVAAYQDGRWQINAVRALQGLEITRQAMRITPEDLDAVQSVKSSSQSTTLYQAPGNLSDSNGRRSRIRFKSVTVNIDQSHLHGQILLPNGETIFLDKFFSIPELIYCFSDDEDGSDVGSAFRFVLRQTLGNIFGHLQRELPNWDLQPEESQAFLEAISEG